MFDRGVTGSVALCQPHLELLHPRLAIYSVRVPQQHQHYGVTWIDGTYDPDAHEIRFTINDEILLDRVCTKKTDDDPTTVLQIGMYVTAQDTGGPHAASVHKSSIPHVVNSGVTRRQYYHTIWAPGHDDSAIEWQWTHADVEDEALFAELRVTPGDWKELTVHSTAYTAGADDATKCTAHNGHTTDARHLNLLCAEFEDEVGELLSAPSDCELRGSTTDNARTRAMDFLRQRISKTSYNGPRASGLPLVIGPGAALVFFADAAQQGRQVSDKKFHARLRMFEYQCATAYFLTFQLTVPTGAVYRDSVKRNRALALAIRFLLPMLSYTKDKIIGLDSDLWVTPLVNGGTRKLDCEDFTAVVFAVVAMLVAHRHVVNEAAEDVPWLSWVCEELDTCRLHAICCTTCDPRLVYVSAHTAWIRFPRECAAHMVPMLERMDTDSDHWLVNLDQTMMVSGAADDHYQLSVQRIIDDAATQTLGAGSEGAIQTPLQFPTGARLPDDRIFYMRLAYSVYMDEKACTMRFAVVNTAYNTLRQAPMPLQHVEGYPEVTLTDYVPALSVFPPLDIPSLYLCTPSKKHREQFQLGFQQCKSSIKKKHKPLDINR